MTEKVTPESGQDFVAKSPGERAAMLDRLATSAENNTNPEAIDNSEVVGRHNSWIAEKVKALEDWTTENRELSFLAHTTTVGAAVGAIMPATALEGAAAGFVLGAGALIFEKMFNKPISGLANASEKAVRSNENFLASLIGKGRA